MLVRIMATEPDERFLFYPYLQLLPFLTDRRQVSMYDLFTPGYTTPLQYRETCIAAMQQAQWLVIDRVWDAPEAFLRLFPSLAQPNPPERTRTEQALERGFTFVAREGSLELRQRAAGVDETVCAGIAN